MKKLLSIMLAVVMLLAMCVVSVQAYDIECGNVYDESMLRGFVADYITQKRDDIKLFDSTYDEVSYTVLYSHYSDDMPIPNFVLIDIDFKNNASPESAIQIGDYIITNDAWYGYNPYFLLGYFIVLPDTGEVINLETAHNRQIDGFERIFTETDIARIIGDTDKDGIISIKDATYIQKLLAQFEGYTKDYYTLIPYVMKYYFADFNGDFDVTISDATEIQKCVAGLEYEHRYEDDMIYTSVPETAKEVVFEEKRIKYFGSDGYIKSCNKLITSESEYRSYFLESSDVYNEEFFENKSLVYLYRWYSTGSMSYQVNSVYAENNVLYIQSHENTPRPGSFVTCDIGVYERFIIVDKADVGEVDTLMVDEDFVYIN